MTTNGLIPGYHVVETREGNYYLYLIDNNSRGKFVRECCFLTVDRYLPNLTHKEVPDIDSITEANGIEADWFKDAYSGSQDFSELNAIQLYRTFNDTFDELSEMYLGVAIVEMGHMEKLSGLIKKLGGNLIVEYNNTELVKSINNGSKSIRDSLQEAIQGEEDTIAEYNRLKEMCNGVEDSDTKTVALNLLDKLIADETKHIELFNEALRQYPVKEGYKLSIRV